VKIDDYFVSIERSLNQNPQISKIEEPIILLTSDDYNGLIRCRVTFWKALFWISIKSSAPNWGIRFGLTMHTPIFTMTS
jgi:hypothetical protein